MVRQLNVKMSRRLEPSGLPVLAIYRAALLASRVGRVFRLFIGRRRFSRHDLARTQRMRMSLEPFLLLREASTAGLQARSPTLGPAPGGLMGLPGRAVSRRLALMVVLCPCGPGWIRLKVGWASGQVNVLLQAGPLELLSRHADACSTRGLLWKRLPPDGALRPPKSRLIETAANIRRPPGPAVGLSSRRHGPETGGAGPWCRQSSRRESGAEESRVQSSAPGL